MKLPLKEPLFAKYLYVSPENIVHIFMPIVSGTSIGLDNTCKAVYALQEFFNKGSNSTKKAALKGELLAYKETLESDLSLLGRDSALAQQKQERLSQINTYLEVITQLEEHPELNCLNHGFPSYPRPLEAIMQDRNTSNLYSMVLRPTVEDGYLRSEAANPIFSVAHQSEAKKRYNTISPLQQALIQFYTPLTFESKDSKSQVIQQVLAQLPDKRPVDFEQLRAALQRTVEALLNVSVDFRKTQQGTTLTQQDIDEAMGFNAQTSPDEYIEALLGYCAPDLFDTVIESPFNTLTDKEAWSIATQFLLGITNIYGVTQGKLSPDTNFGQILDSNPDLSKSLAQTLAEAQKSNRSIEETCLSWINAHKEMLKLNTDLNEEDFKTIKDTFAKRYAEIKDAPHFDEFFILDTQKKGSFFIHQGSICASFAQFASSPLFDLPPAIIQPLEKAHSHTHTLSTEIPHKNPLVQGEVEINTQGMDNTELQALYERINTYKDPKLKAELLAQFKQEQPDFKPKIDPKEFLQHIAYGEQDEAEALLQKDPEVAQALLRADNIPFTDHAGRTFTCTAYEYAYWAMDTHICRMMEKYMDADTKQAILERVQRIEELVGPGLIKKPRGLAYTQNGETHQSAHFDLTPLKEALTTFIEEFNKIPDEEKTQADWDALDALWIKVGLPQSDVPAHIAHEYCHPSRSFAQVVNNPSLLDASNPDNLKRQLKICNPVIQDDNWFIRGSNPARSGLGSTFAVLRGIMYRAGAQRGGGRRLRDRGVWDAECDLSAIKAIDEVRTKDLKQSLENLTAPANLQVPTIRRS